SHDPADLPRLEGLLDRFDAVVGSRRVPGGGCDGWPWYRNALSRGGSLYAQVILSSPVSDLTTGFKGFTRRALAALPLADLRADGYGFQIEVSSHLVGLGFRVHEMPIRFVDRERGQSKMSTRIMLEAVGMVWRIRTEMRRRYSDSV
ncbi:MAG: polyprenol monophosphomannose synthase, partial [Myxococcota bacterium]